MHNLFTNLTEIHCFTRVMPAIDEFGKRMKRSEIDKINRQSDFFLENYWANLGDRLNDGLYNIGEPIENSSGDRDE